MKKYFGTDGVRGKANIDLTAEMALRLGRAAVRALGGDSPRIVVGRDTRISGLMLESALLAGLLAEGADAVMAGVLPTPGIAFLTEDLGADAGVVISASHNAYYDNGIKFFGPGGVKLPDETEKAVEDEFELLGEDTLAAGQVGLAEYLPDAEERYVEHLVSCVGTDLSGLRVALDLAHGAAYRVGPRAFRELGATVETIGCEPDGQNINDRIGSTHTDRLVQLVRGWDADAGFAMDGDADRCIAVDESGEPRDGDYQMAIAARYLKDRGLLHPPLVVATVMSNMGFFLALDEMGVESMQVQVGDRYVMEGMIERGALVGGEQSGHIIFREHASTGDGTLTALLLAGMIKESGTTLSELSKVMKKYPQVLINVRPRSGRRLSDDMAVWDTIRAYERELGSSGRVLVRSSGTEPLERVMVEASSARRARDVAQAIADAIINELEH